MRHYNLIDHKIEVFRIMLRLPLYAVGLSVAFALLVFYPASKVIALRINLVPRLLPACVGLWWKIVLLAS